MPRRRSEPEEPVAFRPGEEPSAEERRGSPKGRLAVEEAPGRRMISLRLREDLLEGLKEVARQRCLPYQVLIQMWLRERLEAEMARPDEPIVQIRLTPDLQRLLVKRTRSRGGSGAAAARGGQAGGKAAP